MEELAIFLGVFLGCLARSLVPFMRKLSKFAKWEGKPFTWDHHYTASMIVAIFVGFVASMFVLPTAIAEHGLGGGLLAFAGAFLIGFGSNGIVNEIMKLVGVV